MKHHMKLSYFISTICLAASLGGCKTLSLDNAKPAVITSPSENSQNALSSAIQELLNNTKVTIADNAFTQSNRLVLQRKPVIGPDGLPIQTRVDEPPFIIRLYKLKNQCVIEYEKNGELKIVDGVSCKTLTEK